MKFNLLILILLLPFLALPQEHLGLRLENYAGVSSISLNPAGNLTNPLKWDFNLIGAGVYWSNNYAFLKKTSTLNLIKNAKDIEFILAENANGTETSNIYILDFKDNGKKRFLSINAMIAGPSLVVRIHENHSVGIFTNLRMAVSTLDFPNILSYYKYDRKANYDPFPVGQFKGAFMSWSEIGINYAIRVPTYFGYMGFGVNVKKLQGYEAAYVENLQTWVHTKLPEDNIIAENTFGKYGLTTSNLKDSGFGAVANGGGFGIDLGFLYVIQEYEDGYKWRFGASLLDIGSIKFEKNAQTHTIKNSYPFQLNLRDFGDFELLGEGEAFLRHFSDGALGDPSASLTGNSFKMALPAAISLQADYNFNEKIFLNSLLIHRVPTQIISPQRETLLALTPRYERRWFSASMPISLLNWQEVRMGLAARLGFFVVGSEKIGSIFGKSDYSGTDFYVALKLNPFDLGWGLFDGGISFGNHKHGSRKNAKCYDF